MFFVFRACLAFWRGRVVRSLAPSPPFWLLTPPRTPARGSVKEGWPSFLSYEVINNLSPIAVSVSFSDCKFLCFLVGVEVSAVERECTRIGRLSCQPACLRVVLQVEPRPQRLRGRTGLACLGGNNQLAWKEGKRETADRERGEGQLPPLLLRLAQAVKFGG